MKWKKKPEPKKGDTTVKIKFLWLPLKIGDETRWLETAHVRRECVESEIGIDHQGNYIWECRWENTKFED